MKHKVQAYATARAFGMHVVIATNEGTVQSCVGFELKAATLHVRGDAY